MKLSASSVIASLVFATSLVAASSSPDLTARTTTVNAPGSHPLVDRTFSWDWSGIIGDFLSPLYGNTCSSGLFYWGGVSKCLKTSYTTTQPSSSTKSCPDDWTWSSDINCCKPKTSAAASTSWPTCTKSGHNWLSNIFICALDDYSASSSSSCDSSYQFWWSLGSLCCKSGGGSDSTSNLPSDTSCPDNWYYSSKYNFCLPKSSSYSTSTSCSTGSWDSSSKCCKVKRDSNGCDTSSQFWWSLGSFCIDNNHDTSGQCSDSTKSCPTNYSWSTSKGFCIPKTSSACNNVGSCSKSWHTWWPAHKYCSGSSPSQRKRSARRTSSLPLGHVDAARCPDGGTACPLSLGSFEYECLKPLEEIDSCGGCVTLGQGQDCTAIAGAKSVGCQNGVCEVYKCTRGFSLSPDRKTCVPTQSTGSKAYLTSQARQAKRATI